MRQQVASDWLVAWLMVLAATAVMAEELVRVTGRVMGMSGHMLTLQSDRPSPPGYRILGRYVVLVPGPPVTITCDLGRLAQTDYAHVRPGESVSVIGVMSSDGRHLTATSLVRGPEEQAP